jgi:transcriptional regulator with XRE-family HTH domain
MGMKEVGTYVRELRRGRDLTQAELAMIVHVSKPTIERLERGEQNVAAQTLAQIIAWLGGVPDDVQNLYMDEGVRDRDAKHLARKALDQLTIDPIYTWLNDSVSGTWYGRSRGRATTKKR